MYVEGRVLTTGGEPIPGAIIDTWETDSTGERHFEMHVHVCALRPDDECLGASCPCEPPALAR